MDLFKWLTEEHTDMVSCSRVDNMVEITTKRGSHFVELKNGEDYYEKVLEIIKEEFEKIKNPKGKLFSIETRKDYGETGIETKLTDVYGNKLYTGDVVKVFNGDDQVEKAFVAKDFIMGYRSSSYKNKNGILDGKYIIVKCKSYKDLSHNDRVGKLKYYEED